MNPPPRDTAFFDRKRRLAYRFAWASIVFLFIQTSLSFFLEFTTRPRAAAAADGLRVVHRSFNPDDPDGSRLVTLDGEAKPSAPPLNFPDNATALLIEDRGLTLFFGTHAARLADGQIARSVELNQKWDVLAALPDPGGDWIFGWTDNQIVARRREKEGWASEIVLAKSAAVDHVVASRDGAAGPLVAWRERGSPKVRTALYDGAAFALKGEFDIGPAEHWDLVLRGARQLLVVYNRDDRTYQYVTLRLECCAGCPSPLPLRKVRFSEPVLLLGRKVTGLCAVVARDRLRVFITRMSTLMTASLPLATLEPDPGASKLQSISSQAPWRHLVAAFCPVLLIFCSFSMIFLGYILFRERARLARGIPVPGPQPADFLPRAMAFVLDHILLVPFVLVVIELANVGPDSGVPDLQDPRFMHVVYVSLGLHFLYYFLMEWRCGWTVGKRIIGLRVAELDGSKLTLKGALVRSLVRLFDAELPLGALVGTAVLLSSKRRQRLGDLIARTIVVVDLPD